ncbi:putative mitochondrial p-glycoprotein e [Leptomonas pyrrhocoris]|uniref:Putative mitochondrial p-glycoprotein e n=1 Tax=Leptomonas pyrrhocoris TaxID=157538 RepID=A0A0M9FYU5_LEPPY|nr:putative mitochondrial p-glycoprotein e [Leptomonas pyrrhocoris]KPA78920.1 putative mitochondrial p-glycoprotein e [Leptomonas pyrrhocoris]|eukprot:XP_015657359.1 putative mitochondrial p-glycoprotein e [Leptomonas pyrrhocoris]
MAEHTYRRRLCACEERRQQSERERADRLCRLWGEEVPYAAQAEDRANWVGGTLFYTWLGDFMHRAAHEALTLDGLPRPTHLLRSYNSGTALSRALQQQRTVEHAWDTLVDTALVRYTGKGRAAQNGVVRRAWRMVVRLLGWGLSGGAIELLPSGLRPGAVGVLRWCGPAQQLGTNGQRYAGVEWYDSVVAAAQSSLPHRGRNSSHKTRSAWTAGTVGGEHLFRTSDGRATATCECVEDVEIIASPCARSGGERNSALPQLARMQPRGMSASRAFFTAFWKPFLLLLPLRIGRDFATLLSPLVLRLFIQYIEKFSSGEGDNAAKASGKPVGDTPLPSWGAGMGLVLLMFAFALGESLVNNKYYQMCGRTGASGKCTLAAVIFEKAMTISSKATALPTMNPGRLVNMVSNDAQSANDFVYWIWALVGAPLQLIGGVALLYSLVGWSAFVGVLGLLLSLPLQNRLTQQMYAAFKEKAAVTDARLKATNEFLSGIRVVKFMSWEPSFIVKIEALRAQEIAKIRRTQMLAILISFLNAAAPNLVIATVFVMYTLGGHALTVATVFPVIALLGVLESPFVQVPYMVASLSRFIVSMRRITRFLECDDSTSAVMDMVQLMEEEEQECQVEWAADDEARNAYRKLYAARFQLATLSAFVPVRLPSAADVQNGPATAEMSTNSAEDDLKTKAERDDSAESPTGEALYELRVKTLLEDVDLRIPRGKLTVVLGPTGCGKSTLLDSLIGALAVTRGRVACSRCVAYVPQQPWIMSATLRDNVVFFGAADDAAFERAVASSQLAADLALLAAGAATEIGEKGINLSGGQKARVSLARAVYADRDVYVLDDPLSALDAHVGERVMRECVCGALAHKTRVLATHQVSAAAYADYVVVLSAGGPVAFQGDAAAYSVYCDLQIDLPAMENALKSKEDAKAAAVEMHTAIADGASDDRISEDFVSVQREAERADRHTGTAAEADVSSTGALITAEEMAEGSVPLSIYRRYAIACGGVASWMGIFGLHAATEVGMVLPSLWLSLWASGAVGWSETTNLKVYLACTAVAIIGHPLRRYCTYRVLRVGCATLHSSVLRSVSSGTMAFFDTTPHGRLLNRFSQDLSRIDDDLEVNVIYFLNRSCTVLSSLLVMVYTQWQVLLPLVMCSYLYYRLMVFYTAANRSIRRHENIANSPVLSTLGSILSGRWTIHAYGVGHPLLQSGLQRLDHLFSCIYMRNTGQHWLAVRVELLSNVVITAVAFIAVVTVNQSGGTVPQTRIGLLSLSMTMAMKVSLLLNDTINLAAQAEADMSSVERVLHYIDNIDLESTQRDIAAAVDAHAAQIRRLMDRAVEVTVEDGGGAAALSPLSPASAGGVSPTVGRVVPGAAGSLVLEHVDMRYRPGLPLVLRDVSFAVLPGQKVGVVGRTGSGKSTLLLALLRLVEVCGGCMRVCGRDARDYGVRELRQLFSMIPQDPLLFDGTVRSNVDPFGACGDAAVWAALRQVGMEERVRSGGGGLDARVQEGGSNFSVGQRQLLCLARALLKRGSAFLLMDEATANVDPALDRQIQLTVQQTFRDYTVVTIAHRLHTVAAYDVILVMDGGRAVEFGSPRALVNTEGSLFASLVKSLGEDGEARFMKAMAQEAEHHGREGTLLEDNRW